MNAQVRGGYVDSAWGQVHYRVAGESGPWIGLLHESPLSSRAFEKVLAILGEHARVVAFDTPGYGSSDPPPTSEEDIPAYALVIAQAAKAIGMERPVFAGVHTGASLAIALAHITDAAGICLSGVPLFSAAERADFLQHWNPPIPIDDEGSQLEWVRERYQRTWPDLTPEMLHTACTEVLRVADRYDWGYRAAFRYDPSQTLANLEVPVFLLDAEYDMLAPYDATAMELATDCRLTILPGLKGQPHLRASQAYSEHLLEFALAVTG